MEEAGVAESGLRSDVEHRAQVLRVSAGDGGLFEDSVLAKLLGGDREAAQQRLRPAGCDRGAGVRGLRADEQVRVAGMWPALVPEADVVEGGLLGEGVDG